MHVVCYLFTCSLPTHHCDFFHRSKTVLKQCIWSTGASKSTHLGVHLLCCVCAWPRCELLVHLTVLGVGGAVLLCFPQKVSPEQSSPCNNQKTFIEDGSASTVHALQCRGPWVHGNTWEPRRLQQGAPWTRKQNFICPFLFMSLAKILRTQLNCGGSWCERTSKRLRTHS